MNDGEMYTGNDVWSVTEVNEYVRLLLESQPPLRNIWLRGEISNFKNHYKTGHYYFSLKDEMSALRAVMFRGANVALPFMPQDGMRVLVRGKVVSYPRDGQTQMVVSEMVPDGAGSLALAFEQVRRRLEAEGLFAQERKKSLPRYPRSIGIVTSPTGAAIHDMIRIVTRRYPIAQLILFPALVQGDGAARSIQTGVEFFNSVDGLVDVMIVGRGGGSAEDLWAFNDEALARSIAASRIPVISAVGHESDVTICDFVADCRASTPSGAAELAVPDRVELCQLLAQRAKTLRRCAEHELRAYRNALDVRARHRMLLSPRELFDMRTLGLCHREERLQVLLQKGLDAKRATLGKAAAALEGRNPLSILTRGFAMVTDTDGHAHTHADQISVGDELQLHFFDGVVTGVAQHVKLTSNLRIKDQNKGE